MELIGQMKTWITSKNSKILPTYSYKQQKNLSKYINSTRICACLVSSLSKARKKDGGGEYGYLIMQNYLSYLHYKLPKSDQNLSSSTKCGDSSNSAP